MKYQPNEQDYNIYVSNITPSASTARNCLWAFLVGGAICTLGQLITNIMMYLGINEEDSAGYTSVMLVLFSVILTSLGLYKKIAKYGGAGALVPITGFANGVCAPIVEFQTEGEVFGKGVKAFTIAGPVILYGILSSFLMGLIYWGAGIAGWR
jgi:stage V sporulation protein AC